MLGSLKFSVFLILLAGISSPPVSAEEPVKAEESCYHFFVSPEGAWEDLTRLVSKYDKLEETSKTEPTARNLCDDYNQGTAKDYADAYFCGFVVGSLGVGNDLVELASDTKTLVLDVIEDPHAVTAALQQFASHPLASTQDFAENTAVSIMGEVIEKVKALGDELRGSESADYAAISGEYTPAIVMALVGGKLVMKAVEKTTAAFKEWKRVRKIERELKAEEKARKAQELADKKYLDSLTPEERSRVLQNRYEQEQRRRESAEARWREEDREAEVRRADYRERRGFVNNFLDDLTR